MMPRKTHKDFETVVPSVKDAMYIYSHFKGALFYQRWFKKKTTPWELKDWRSNELERFKVDVMKIDRLYYIKKTSDRCGLSYSLVFRMDYSKNKKHKRDSLYVELFATFYHCYHFLGYIFVSRDANVFMKLVSRPKDKTLVYESLRKDGIHAEKEEVCEEEEEGVFCKTPNTLKYLCQEAVYLSRDMLRGFASVLPKLLTNSVDDFVKTKEAKATYCSVTQYMHCKAEW